MLGTFFDQLTDYQLVKKDSSPFTVPNERTRVHADLDTKAALHMETLCSDVGRDITAG